MSPNHTHLLPFIKTEAYWRFCAICETTINTATITVIAGEAGVGITAAAHQYIMEQACLARGDPSILYVPLAWGDKTERHLAQRLGETMATHQEQRSVRANITELGQCLKEAGYRAVMFDNVPFLQPRGLDAVAMLHEQINIPIMLLTLASAVQSLATSPTLWPRVALVLTVEPLTTDDIRRHVLPHLSSDTQIRFDPHQADASAIAKELKHISGGRFRDLGYVLAVASELIMMEREPQQLMLGADHATHDEAHVPRFDLALIRKVAVLTGRDYRRDVAKKRQGRGVGPSSIEHRVDEVDYR